MPETTNHEALIERARVKAEHADTIRAGLSQMERLRKIVIAQQKESERARLKREGEKFTEARLEDLARASKAYVDHCADMEEVEKELAGADAEKWAAKNAVDLMLSRMATERAEMNAYGPDAKPAKERREVPLPPLADFQQEY